MKRRQRTNAMGKKRLLALGILLVAVAAAVFGVARPIIGAARPASEFDGGVLSVLDRPQQPTDAIPPRVLALPTARDDLAYPVISRLALGSPDGDVFVARGTGNRVCAVVTEVDLSAIDCADAKLLARGKFTVLTQNPDGSWDVVGVVDDRFRQARAAGSSAAVRNNVFQLVHVSIHTLSLVAADGSVTQVDLGPLEPTGGTLP
jgi:hypothetical protein